MRENVIVDILNICISIEKKTLDLYFKLSQYSNSEELKNFWLEIYNDEKEHITLWEKLLDFAKKDIIPQVFEKPFETKNEIENIYSRLQEYNFDNINLTDISKQFLVAYRIEFYLLNDAFKYLFFFLETVPGEKSPLESYELHLNKINEGLKKFLKASEELKLISETINKIFKEHCNLAFQSHIDSLTGVLNRRGLFNALTLLSHIAQRNNHNLAIMLVDIDNFKNINDVFGYQKGDSILKLIASIIKSHLRISDIVGRYGGDQFLIALFNVEESSIQSIAEKIRNKVVIETKETLPITLSIGVACGYLDRKVGKDLNNLIEKSEKCLLLSKKTGKNKVIVYDENDYKKKEF